MIVKDVTRNAGSIVTGSKENVAQILACLFIERVTVLQGYLSPAIIFVELQVYHARHRIRSVGCGSAILQYVDALNGCNRDGSYIKETVAGVGSHSERDNAPAIDQNQCGTRIEASKRDRSRPRRTGL